MKYWVGDGCIYLKIPSKSREGKFKLLRINDVEAVCMNPDDIPDIIGYESDDFVDCPACTYGKYCNKARKMMDVLGLIY